MIRDFSHNTHLYTAGIHSSKAHEASTGQLAVPNLSFWCWCILGLVAAHKLQRHGTVEGEAVTFFFTIHDGVLQEVEMSARNVLPSLFKLSVSQRWLAQVHVLGELAKRAFCVL